MPDFPERLVGRLPDGPRQKMGSFWIPAGEGSCEARGFAGIGPLSFHRPPCGENRSYVALL